MKLRIIAGSQRGRHITISDKIARFRPTKDRVRQAVAEIIKTRIVNAVVADICAGSGAFGMECLSRGALEAHFVEQERALTESISNHLERFGLKQRSQIINQDARNYIRGCKNTYDIIFYDPPYSNRELAGLVPGILPLLSLGGIFLYEQSAGNNNLEIQEIPFDHEMFSRESRIYGDTRVDFYSRHVA